MEVTFKLARCRECREEKVGFIADEPIFDPLDVTPIICFDCLYSSYKLLKNSIAALDRANRIISETLEKHANNGGKSSA